MKLCWGRLVGNREGSVEIAGRGGGGWEVACEWISFISQNSPWSCCGQWIPIWDAHAELTRMVVSYHCQSISPLAHVFPPPLFSCVCLLL